MKIRSRFDRGAAAVELALVTIPIVLIALATLEFSFALNQYHSLSKRVHDAARYLTQFDPASPDFSSTHVNNAFNLVQGADVAASSAFQLPSLESPTQGPLCTVNCLFVCSSGFSTTSRCTGSPQPYYWPATGALNGIRALTVGVYRYQYTPKFFPAALANQIDLTFPMVAVTLPQGI